MISKLKQEDGRLSGMMQRFLPRSVLDKLFVICLLVFLRSSFKISRVTGMSTDSSKRSLITGKIASFKMHCTIVLEEQTSDVNPVVFWSGDEGTIA